MCCYASIEGSEVVRVSVARVAKRAHGGRLGSSCWKSRAHVSSRKANLVCARWKAAACPESEAARAAEGFLRRFTPRWVPTQVDDSRCASSRAVQEYGYLGGAMLTEGSPTCYVNSV